MELAPDKILHIKYGFVISLVAGVVLTPVLGFCVSTVVGILKEVVWDYYMKKGTPEVMDAVATSAGGLGALLLQILF